MAHTVAGRYRRRIAGAAALSLAILIAELVAGVLSNSLALLSDAAHTFADVSGLLLSLAAIWLAQRPTTIARSFGLYRLEILAATANGLVLLDVAALVLLEAVQRLTAAPAVLGRSSWWPWWRWWRTSSPCVYWHPDNGPA